MVGFSSKDGAVAADQFVMPDIVKTTGEALV
jgi:hypothetical protein